MFKIINYPKIKKKMAEKRTPDIQFVIEVCVDNVNRMTTRIDEAKYMQYYADVSAAIKA